MPITANCPPEVAASRIILAETPDFDLGGLRVSPAHREVRMGSERKELEPKVLQVLVALAGARPDVVSRDRLIEQCWDGRIVGDDALNRCIVALRQLAREFSPQPFAIETVPRVGYCLTENPAGNGVRVAGPQRANWKLMVTALIAVAAAGTLLLSSPRNNGSATAPASIAVLPFRNLSAGDPYFAEGVGEEIRIQLSREPQFRIAGGNSSSQLEKSSNLREVAKRLNVNYVVEGSVRSQNNHVRVNSALVRASDGMRLWADSYEGDLNDIFAIQQQIGGAIASSLRRKLIRTAALSGPLVTNGQAYNLYLTAHGLLRTQRREVGPAAVVLLQDAIKLDRGYAPAWASLAKATLWEGAMSEHEGMIAIMPKAQRYARHALQLAPDLAEAHLWVGTLAETGSPEAQRHVRRAAVIEPNNSEILIGLGAAQNDAGEFKQEIETYRRANQIDPLWFRTVGSFAIATAEMGNRAAAEAIGKRGFAKDINNLHIILGRTAWIAGDYSEAARHWSIVAGADSPRWSAIAAMNLEYALFTTGLGKKQPPKFVTTARDQRRRQHIWMDSPPTKSVWRARNRSLIASDVYRNENLVAAKLMLIAGRAAELSAAYDSPVGLIGLRRGQSPRVVQLAAVPVAALALRLTGRAAEADRLLRRTDKLVRDVYRRNAVPFWFEGDAASLFATEGKRDEALATLERAMARGWVHNNISDLRDIADEPAFRPLRGVPRFERLRARLAAHNERERAETMRLRI